MKRKLLWFTVGFALMLFGMQTLANHFIFGCVAVFAAVTAVICAFVRPMRVLIPLFLGILLANLWFPAYEALWPQNEHIGSEKKNYIVATAQEYSTPAKSGTGVWCRALVTMVNGKTQKSRTSVNLFLSGADTVVTPGDQIEFFGELLPYENSEDFMSFTYHKTRFLDGQAFCHEFRIKPVEEKSLRYLPVIISQKIKEKIEFLFGDTKGLFRAMLTGDRSMISAELTEKLRITGMSHVIAISGMHISYLAYFLILLFGKRRAPNFAIPIILCFGVMIGPLPSVMRSLFMQCVVLVAPLIKREADTLTSLAAALLMILLINPYSVLDVGLQLSFGATLGLVLYGERANAKVREYLPVQKRFLFKILDSFATTFVASLCAMVFTVPITMLTFGSISLISPIANMLTLWSVSLLFITGIVAVALSFVSFPIGKILAFPAMLFAKFFTGATRVMAQIPYADFSARNPFLIRILVLCYLLFFILYYLKPRPSHSKAIVRVYLGMLGACVVGLILSIVLNQSVTATVLDVGQGQSILLQSRAETIIIDCGSMDQNAAQVTYDAVFERSNRTIDAIVLTHLDSDHINGVETVLNRLNVKRLYLYHPLAESEKASKILKTAEEVGTEVVPVIYWRELEFKQFQLELLPIPKGTERGLAILVKHNAEELLITGDINAEGENYLIHTYRLPDTEYLVVGHHGSKYSTSEELIAKIKPEIAIISVGAKNNYGHPAKEVLNRLDEAKVCTKRTDLDGSISVKFQ